MVWFRDTVYLKPLPSYLLNYRFWTLYLFPHVPSHSQQPVDAQNLSPTCRAAFGFLRSYGYLIKHESDYHLALESHLVPCGMSFQRFRLFIAAFEAVPDELVSSRYHYGQLRLTRLNWAVRFVGPKTLDSWLPWNNHNRYWHTEQAFHELGPALLGIFAILSLALSAMQVLLATADSNQWPAFRNASSGFLIGVLVVSLAIILAAPFGVVCLLLSQLVFAVKQRRKQ